MDANSDFSTALAACMRPSNVVQLRQRSERIRELAGILSRSDNSAERSPGHTAAVASIEFADRPKLSNLSSQSGSKEATPEPRRHPGALYQQPRPHRGYSTHELDFPGMGINEIDEDGAHPDSRPSSAGSRRGATQSTSLFKDVRTLAASIMQERGDYSVSTNPRAARKLGLFATPSGGSAFVGTRPGASARSQSGARPSSAGRYGPSHDRKWTSVAQTRREAREAREIAEILGQVAGDSSGASSATGLLDGPDAKQDSSIRDGAHQADQSNDRTTYEAAHTGGASGGTRFLADAFQRFSGIRRGGGATSEAGTSAAPNGQGRAQVTSSNGTNGQTRSNDGGIPEDILAFARATVEAHPPRDGIVSPKLRRSRPSSRDTSPRSTPKVRSRTASPAMRPARAGMATQPPAAILSRGRDPHRSARRPRSRSRSQSQSLPMQAQRREALAPETMDFQAAGDTRPKHLRRFPRDPNGTPVLGSQPRPGNRATGSRGARPLRALYPWDLQAQGASTGGGAGAGSSQGVVRGRQGLGGRAVHEHAVRGDVAYGSTEYQEQEHHRMPGRQQDSEVDWEQVRRETQAVRTSRGPSPRRRQGASTGNTRRGAMPLTREQGRRGPQGYEIAGGARAWSPPREARVREHREHRPRASSRPGLEATPGRLEITGQKGPRRPASGVSLSPATRRAVAEGMQEVESQRRAQEMRRHEAAMAAASTHGAYGGRGVHDSAMSTGSMPVHGVHAAAGTTSREQYKQQQQQQQQQQLQQPGPPSPRGGDRWVVRPSGTGATVIQAGHHHAGHHHSGHRPDVHGGQQGGVPIDARLFPRGAPPPVPPPSGVQSSATSAYLASMGGARGSGGFDGRRGHRAGQPGRGSSYPYDHNLHYYQRHHHHQYSQSHSYIHLPGAVTGMATGRGGGGRGVGPGHTSVAAVDGPGVSSFMSAGGPGVGAAHSGAERDPRVSVVDPHALAEDALHYGTLPYRGSKRSRARGRTAGPGPEARGGGESMQVKSRSKSVGPSDRRQRGPVAAASRGGRDSPRVKGRPMPWEPQ